MIRKAMACLVLAVLLLTAVSALEISGVTIDDLTGVRKQAPAETAQPLTTTLPDATATPIRPAAQERQSDAERVTLYFRYHQTDYLGVEEREISVPRDDTVELCIVQALISGPSSAYQELTPVFSPDVRVVSTSRSGETVTVTLTRAFLDAPSDAPDGWESLPYWRSEVMLRRRLALQSIVSALTENGRCERVQILLSPAEGDIRGERILRAQIYEDEEDETLTLEPLARDENAILTPRTTMRAALSMWRAQSWPTLYVFVTGDGDERLPSQTEFIARVSALRASLLGFDVGVGSVSMDGTRATVNVDVRIQRGDGSQSEAEAVPVALVREGGNWKLPYESLLSLMER